MVTKFVRKKKGLYDYEWVTVTDDVKTDIKKEVSYDINNDGKFDGDDVSIAGKVLSKSKSVKKPRKSKK